MKKILLWIAAMVFLTAIIPIIICPKQRENHADTKQNIGIESETPELSREEIDALTGCVMEYITEDYESECIRAVTILCKNNALVQKSKGIKPQVTKISNYSDELYMQITDIIEKDKTSLNYNGEMVYIPLVNLSPGYIVESEEYPYITGVACPWDTLNPQFVKGYDYSCGISVNGLNAICSMGFDSNQVLSYFLPQLHIK